MNWQNYLLKLCSNIMASFPSKDERTICWSARDKYWSCLDAHEGNVNSCTELRKVYENSCPSQWVKHFDRRYQFLKFKQKVETEGFEKFDEKKPHDLPSGKSKSNRLWMLGPLYSNCYCSLACMILYIGQIEEFKVGILSNILCELTLHSS